MSSSVCETGWNREPSGTSRAWKVWAGSPWLCPFGKGSRCRRRSGGLGRRHSAHVEKRPACLRVLPSLVGKASDHREPAELGKIGRDAAPGLGLAEKEARQPDRRGLGEARILLHDPFRRLQKLFGRLPGDLPHRAGHLRPEIRRRAALLRRSRRGPRRLPLLCRLTDPGGCADQSIEQSLRVEHRILLACRIRAWPPAQRGQHGLVQRFSAAASRARRVMAWKSPSAIVVGGATQVPPTQGTLGSAR